MFAFNNVESQFIVLLNEKLKTFQSVLIFFEPISFYLNFYFLNNLLNILLIFQNELLQLWHI